MWEELPLTHCERDKGTSLVGACEQVEERRSCKTQRTPNPCSHFCPRSHDHSRIWMGYQQLCFPCLMTLGTLLPTCPTPLICPGLPFSFLWGFHCREVGQDTPRSTCTVDPVSLGAGGKRELRSYCFLTSAGRGLTRLYTFMLMRCFPPLFSF